MMTIEETGKLLKDDSRDDLITDCIDRSNHVKLWWICICLALGNAIDAVEIMCVGYIITEIKGLTKFQQELLTSAVFIGMLFGGILCGYISDIVGRRPTLLLSLSLNTTAGFLSASAPNITTLVILRIVGGLGIGGSVPIVFSLGAELFPTPIRGKMISVVASFWMIGAILVALTGWIVLGNDLNGQRICPEGSWRIFVFICAIPVLITFILTYFFVPESPRFLVHKGRYGDAANSLSKLCGVRIDENNMISYYQSKRDESLLPVIHSSVFHFDSLWKFRFEDTTIAYLFQKSLRRTTMVLAAVWFTLSFGSYGISTWITKLFKDIGYENPYADSFIFAAANLPGNIFSILYIESVGRRKLLSVGMLLAAAAALAPAADLASPTLVVTAASVFNACSVAGWNSLDCVSAEHFPTPVRTSAMGTLASCGRIGAICAQFVNGSLQSNIPLLLFVTTLCMVLGGSLAWLLPEDSTCSKLDDFTSKTSDYTSLDNFSEGDNSKLDPLQSIGPNIISHNI